MAEKQLWGGETSKAVENFPISGERVPVQVVRWLARLKGAAAAVNGELGLLSKRTAAKIEKAAREIAEGKHDGQFPIDVFQTGSGHFDEHERQRGDREARRRWCARQRPRQHGPVLKRRVPLGRAPGGARRGAERVAAGA